MAEYKALLRGLQRGGQALGAREVDVVNDSELVAKQLTGAYKVKHPAMKPLHEEAMSALRGFDRWSIRSVPRAQNERADALVAGMWPSTGRRERRRYMKHRMSIDPVVRRLVERRPRHRLVSFYLDLDPEPSRSPRSARR